MPSLTIKTDSNLINDLLPNLDGLEKQLAALMGVPVAACNVMAIKVYRPKASTVSAYLELVFMASRVRSRDMVGEVGQKLMISVQKAIGGDIQFRGFPMSSQTLFSESLRANEKAR